MQGLLRCLRQCCKGPPPFLPPPSPSPPLCVPLPTLSALSPPLVAWCHDRHVLSRPAGFLGLNPPAMTTAARTLWYLPIPLLAISSPRRRRARRTDGHALHAPRWHPPPAGRPPPPPGASSLLDVLSVSVTDERAGGERLLGHERLDRANYIGGPLHAAGAHHMAGRSHRMAFRFGSSGLSPRGRYAPRRAPRRSTASAALPSACCCAYCLLSRPP